MVTYALIHGAHHGAWCWDFFVPELEARGHRAVAIDLPADDTNAGVSEYARIALDAISSAADDIVVVGHSLGGLTAPVVAARRPVQRLVYLAAVVPEPGRSLTEQNAEDGGSRPGRVKIDNGDGTLSVPADDLPHVYYHDCTSERQRYAAARLRPQSGTPHKETSPLARQPDVPTSYIVCSDDRAYPPERQRRTARSRLGIEPIEIPGSHSPFLARPAELADLLTHL